MKTAASVAVLAGLAASAQAAGFGAVAARSGSPIHLQSVNANGGKFWIGKETATYCPSGISGLNCPVGNNETVFAGGNGALALDVVVPGGQQVYIDATTGAVSFTQAHSAATPAGAVFDGWSHTEGGSFGELSHTGGVIFCPSEGVYQMFVQLEGLNFSADCLGADLITPNVTGYGAWQYV